jgi:hypothetical protein
VGDMELSRAIRNALNVAGITDADIDQMISGQLRENDIANDYPVAVGRMLQNKIPFAAALDGELLQLGATWGNPRYNLSALGLSSGAVQQFATEQVTAIRTWTPQNNYDAAKALTDMLRVVKRLERGDVT